MNIRFFARHGTAYRQAILATATAGALGLASTAGAPGRSAAASAPGRSDAASTPSAPHGASIPDSTLDLASGHWDASYFRPGGTYDPAVPTPESVLGFPAGRRPVSYAELRRYLAALDSASARVTVRTYARSHEGRDLVYVAVGTEARVQNLDSVRDAVAAFADPRRPRDLNTPSPDLPLVAWLGYAIHGDELSSTDAALQLAYQLAAGTDSTTERIRSHVLVLIDPAQNPDGRERFVSQMQQLAGRVPNSDAQSLQHEGMWPWGRSNHYYFDLNRDWLFLANPESRGRVAAIAAWNPLLVVDSHEMGWDETYLFSPPREPFNPHLGQALRGWWQVFAGDQAAAFDQRGWSYYTREWNEEFFPGYGSSWGMYRGAVGILYEQAGTDGSSVRQPDGTLLTFREAVAHQFTSSMTNLDTAARHRDALLHDFLAGRREAVDSGRRGPVRAFAYAPGPDPGRATHLTGVLLQQGIEVFRAAGPLTIVDAHDYWGGSFGAKQLPAGSYVVPLDQPLSPLVRNELEFHVAMPDSFLREERDYLERDKGSRLYDVTAWSLLMGHGLESYWTGGAPRGELQHVTSAVLPEGGVEHPHPSYGYLIDGAADASLPAVVRLLETGESVRVALEPFEIAGRRFARGSVLLRVQANPAALDEVVARVAAATGVAIYGTDTGHADAGPDLGGNEFPLLEPPRIALLTGPPVSASAYGEIWQLLDRDLQVRTSSLDATHLQDLDLSKYNVLVLPSAAPGGYAAAFGKDGTEKLRLWVEAGGTLVGIAEGAAFAADTSQALSGARLRQQALKDFAPALAREPMPEVGIMQAVGDRPRAQSAPGLPVLGPAALLYMRQTHPQGVRSIYETETGQRAATAAGAGPGSKAGKESEAKKEVSLKDLERAEARLRRFSPHGAMLRVDLDTDHWLTAGLPRRAPVLLRSSLALVARPPVHVLARYAGADSLHLSGLLWPEGADRVARTAYLTQEKRGKGQVILFADDPLFRRSLPDLERLILNAVLLGPGLGTSRPAPW